MVKPRGRTGSNNSTANGWAGKATPPANGWAGQASPPTAGLSLWHIHPDFLPLHLSNGPPRCAALPGPCNYVGPMALPTASCQQLGLSLPTALPTASCPRLERSLPTASYHAHTAPLLPCAQWQPPDALARTMRVASWRQWACTDCSTRTTGPR